jgi:hypothetical protein
MARTACLVCLVNTVSGCCKNALEEVALEAGTQQNLSYLLFFRYLWLVVAEKIVAVKVSRSIHRAHLPCQPTVTLPSRLPCSPNQGDQIIWKKMAKFFEK